MPLFDFTGPAAAPTSATSFTMNFTDTSNSPTNVNFTLSGTNNASGGLSQYTGGGQISITDSNLATSGPAVFTLDVNNTAALSNFGGQGGNITLDLGFISSSWNITFVNDGTGADQVFTTGPAADAAPISFATTQNYSFIRFSPVNAGGAITIDSLTASITCYLTGTGIATPTGRVAVETLQPGDEILTADGGTTTVRWLGIQPIDTRTATPAKANPICFLAGSIAPNIPSRDLFVSPDHGMEIDGILYNANALVNGRSIYQVAQMPLEGFTYYHIDTGTHALILAEHCPSETYLDSVGREAFVNGAEMADAPIIAEMALPRIAAKRMVPKDVSAALAARADTLGLIKTTRAA